MTSQVVHAIKRHVPASGIGFSTCDTNQQRARQPRAYRGSDGIGLVEYVRFERELAHLLGRKVELTVNTALLREPRFAERVCREAVAI